MNLLGSEEFRERLAEIVSEVRIRGERTSRQKLLMTDLGRLLDIEEWPYLEYPYRQYPGAWFPWLTELTRVAFVPLVSLSWAPGGIEGETSFREAESGVDEPVPGSLFTWKLDFEQGSLLIPDEEDDVPRLIFDLPEETGASAVSLTLVGRAVTALTVFRHHCGTVSNGCPAQKSGCTCHIFRVRTRRDGDTWQCRCSQHGTP